MLRCVSSPPPALSAQVDEGEPPVVALRGELDLTGATVLEPLAARLGADGASHVVLDLGGLDFVDSSGLRTLLELARDLARVGCTVATRAPTGSEARLLIELTRTQAMLGLED
jgi:anti-anti-sigma factor